MTQEDLQRDVDVLEKLRAGCAFYAGPRSRVATLDRAIDIVRAMASMTDDQRDYITRNAQAAAEEDAAIRSDATADAHRKVARLMGGGR